MTRSLGLYGEAVVNSQVEDRKSSIPYRKEYNYITGSVEGSLLLQQIVFRWRGNGKKPFYKFREKCDHPLYRDGDSWTEEMGFGTSQFDRALKDIAAKVTSGSKKSEIEKWSLVTYWTDHQRVTWYSVNERLLNILVGFAYTDQENARKFKLGEILGKWQSPSYLEDAKSATDTFEYAIYLLYKEYSENTSNIQGDFSNEPEHQDEVSINPPSALDAYFGPKRPSDVALPEKVNLHDQSERERYALRLQEQRKARAEGEPWLTQYEWLTKPRSGIERDTLRRVAHTLVTAGIPEPESDAVKARWRSALESVYIESGGDFELIKRAGVAMVAGGLQFWPTHKWVDQVIALKAEKAQGKTSTFKARSVYDDDGDDREIATPQY